MKTRGDRSLPTPTTSMRRKPSTGRLHSISTHSAFFGIVPRVPAFDPINPEMPKFCMHPVGPSVSGVRPGLGWDSPTRGLISPIYFRAAQLLDLNLGAGVFEFLLGLFGLILGNGFLHIDRCAFHKLLGLFEA